MKILIDWDIGKLNIFLVRFIYEDHSHGFQWFWQWNKTERDKQYWKCDWFLSTEWLRLGLELEYGSRKAY